MKRKIEVWDYANEIMKALQKGVLLTTRSGEKINTMTIAWGALGIEWAVPVFITFVRENRYTHQMLEEHPEFTINIPYGEFDKKILGICGTRTGREDDKIQLAGLTVVEPEVISVPAIKEMPLTLECRVIYKQDQNPQAITEENKRQFYPQDVEGSFHGSNRDYHTAYYGEIVAAYIVE